jgi:hypothetical protein
MLPALVAALLLLPAMGPIEAGPEASHRGALHVTASADAWALALGISTGSAKSSPTKATPPKSVCALSDADHDGYDDILVRYAPGLTEGKYKFQALAGPDFTRVLWQAEPQDSRLMKCGADVTGDSTTDPILVAPPTSAPPDAPVSTSPASTTLTPVDGSTGSPLTQVILDASTTTVATPQPAAIETTQGSSGDLLPAGTDALVVVAVTQTESNADPSGAPTTSSTSAASKVEIIDPSGHVEGTVALPPGADSIAVAPVAQDAGPLVVVLTEDEAVPVDQAPLGVPTVAVAGASGTLSWSQQQDATAGVPVVLPVAGDVNGDGHGDIIYATVPADVATVPSSGYAILSGTDGAPIASSGAPQDGLVTALPFGDVDAQKGDEVLVVAQPTPSSPITLAATGSDGNADWTATVPADAKPINVVTDGSGNSIGFTDLTGDGVPDVAVASPSGGQEDGLVITVIDGATGGTAWTATVAGADQAESIPSQDGQAADLVATDDSTSTVTALDGATGETEWQVAPSSTPPGGAVDVQAAGDLDGDGAPDLLVTLSGSDGTTQLHAVSGDHGTTLWSGAGRDGDPAPSALQPTGVSSTTHKAGASLSWWWLLLLAATAILILAAAAWRRRRDDKGA